MPVEFSESIETIQLNWVPGGGGGMARSIPGLHRAAGEASCCCVAVPCVTVWGGSLDSSQLPDLLPILEKHQMQISPESLPACRALPEQGRTGVMILVHMLQLGWKVENGELLFCL